MRIVVRRRIDDTCGIEDDQVGASALTHDTPVIEAQPGRGERGHLAHGVGEREDLLVASVPAEHPREGPVGPRMRLSERQRAVRRVRARVAADADPVLRHDVADIVLAHRVVDDVDGALVLDERVAGPFERIAPGLARQLLDALAGPVRMLAGTGDHDAVPRAARLHLLAADARTDRGIGEPLAHLLRAAFVHPVRDRHREAGGGRGVGVLVRRDVEALPARALDERRRVLHFPPVALARGLVVRQLDAHLAAPADREVLFDRVEELGALVADVARVEAAFVADDRAERGELVRRPERARWIDEPRREADGALVERAREELLHPRELGPRRRPVLGAHHAGAQGPVPDERADVDRGLRAIDRRRVFPERAPRALHVETRELAVELRLGEPAHRRRRAAAVAADDERHAHVDGALHGVVHEHRFVGMRVDVDEPGSDRAAVRVDHARVAVPLHATHARDPVAGDEHVRRERRPAGPVVDRATAEDEVAHSRRRSRPAPRSRRFATMSSFGDRGPVLEPS